MEGCPGSYLTRRQLACHRLSCRSLFSRCLRGYFKVRVGARKSCPPPWQSSIEGSGYTRRGRTAALPPSASLPSRRVRRQHAHTVLECDLQSTSAAPPVVVTTANCLDSCGQQFETAPAVNRWKGTWGDAVVPTRKRLYFPSLTSSSTRDGGRHFSCGNLRIHRRSGTCGAWSGSDTCGQCPAPGVRLRSRRTRPSCRNRYKPCDGGCAGCTGAHSGQCRREMRPRWPGHIRRAA